MNCQFCQQKLIDNLTCHNHPNINVTIWTHVITMQAEYKLKTYKFVWNKNSNITDVYCWKDEQVIGDLLLALPNFPIFPPEQFFAHIQKLLKLMIFS